MSPDHGPSQNANSLMVSKVAGDQSQRASQPLCPVNVVIRRGSGKGNSPHTDSRRYVEGVEQGALEFGEVVVGHDPEAQLAGFQHLHREAFKIVCQQGPRKG
jgi:hypothetical protein